MASKKKQHFVPQFYMRNFSGDTEKKRISLYHLDDDKQIDDIPIKDQNYHDYFYGKDGKIENALAELEGQATKVIAKIISTNVLPDRLSEDYLTLLIFALFQSGRTPVAAAEINEQLEKYLKELARDVPELQDGIDDVKISFTNAPSMVLKTAAESHVFVLDLRWKLLVNNTARLYISSDHPAILYNQFLETRKKVGSNIGFIAKGLQFFLPLGPRHLLMMYDKDVYRIGGRKHLETTINVTEADVRALNALQAANADELLFFSQQTDAKHIAEAVSDGRKHHSDNRAFVKRYEAADGTEELIHSFKADLRIGLKLPSVVIQSSAAGPRLSAAVVQLRDPEFVRLCEEFRSKVESGKYTSSGFGEFIRDRFGSANPS